MLQVPPTPAETLHQAYDIGRQAGLHYVYMGNNLERGVQDTRCAHCNAVVIRRHASKFEANDLSAHGCANCGTLLPGVGMQMSSATPGLDVVPTVAYLAATQPLDDRG